MLKFFSACFSSLVVMFGCNLAIADGVENTSSPTLYGSFRAVSLIGDHAVAVGAVGNNPENLNNGLVLSYKSNDSGNSWSPGIMPPQSATAIYPAGVACYNDGQQICITVGSDYTWGTYPTPTTSLPVIYRSIDDGSTWTQINTLELPASGHGHLMGVACASDGRSCTAVGVDSDFLGNPISYTSTNGGVTWDLHTNFTQPLDGRVKLESVACSSDGQICTTVGIDSEPNSISYTSTDGGVTWELSTKLPASNNNGRVTRVACSSDGQTCVAVGTGRGYTSTDAGKTWALSHTPNAPSMSLSCSSDVISRCVAFGPNSKGTLVSYTSTNGGVNWTSNNISLPLPEGFHGGAFFGVDCSNDGLTCIAVGSIYSKETNDLLASFTTTDGGDTWVRSTIYTLRT